MTNWITAIRPRKPDLSPEKLAVMETYGVEGMKIVLQQAPLQTHNHRSPDARIGFGNTIATRAEIQEWLQWKAIIDALWVKAGVGLALIAAVASVIAAVEGWHPAK